MRRFDVWVVVEEWDGDDKISEVETSCLGRLKDVDQALTLFYATEALGLAVRDYLPIKVEDE